MGSILATVNPPPNGRFKNGMNSHTSASTVAIAIIIADTISFCVFVFFVMFFSSLPFGIKKTVQIPHGKKKKTVLKSPYAGIIRIRSKGSVSRLSLSRSTPDCLFGFHTIVRLF